MKKATLHRSLKLSGFVLAVASMTLAAGVQAQTSSNPGMGRGLYAPGASYIGFNAGRSNFKNLGNGTGLFGSNQRDTSYSLSGGTYFNDNFGVELGYSAFGRVARAGGTTDAEGINLGLVAKAPLGDQFNLLGRIGTTYGRSNVSSAPGSGVVGGRASGFGLSYGVGAEYAFNTNWSAVLQYDEYNINFANSGRSKINTTSVGLRYRF